MTRESTTGSRGRPKGGHDWGCEEMVLPLTPDGTRIRSHGQKAQQAGYLSWINAATSTAYAAASNGVERAKTPSGADQLLGKNVECFVDPKTRDLGPYPRWLCVLRWVCQRLDEEQPKSERSPIAWRPLSTRHAQMCDIKTLKAVLANESLARVSSSIEQPRNPAAWKKKLLDGLTKAFHFGTAHAHVSLEGYTKEDAWSLALASCVNQIRVLDGFRETSFDNLLEVRIAYPGEPLGSDMLGRYDVWLRTGVLPARDDLSRLNCEVYFAENGSARAEQLQFLVGSLTEPLSVAQGASAVTDRAPLLNLVSEANWTGLRAFATRLCFDLRTNPGPDRFALIYVPLSRGAAEKKPLDRAEIVGLLTRAFAPERSALPEGAQHSHSGQASNTNTPTSRYEDDLMNLRRYLTLHRTFLVFDGLEISPQPFGALFDLIKTDWVAFIKTLLQPDFQTLQSTGGAYRSRFIVLSDQPVLGLEPWMSAGPKSLATLRADQDVAKLFESDRIETEMKSLRKRAAFLWPAKDMRPQTEDDSLSVPKLYTLRPQTLKELSSQSKSIPSELDLALAWCAENSSHNRSIPPGHDALAPAVRLNALRAYLHGDRASVGGTVALQFIALSIDGLRLTTLRRCLIKFAAEESDKAVRADVERCLTSLDVPGGVSKFAESHRPLIVKGVDEYAETIPDSRRWFDLDPAASGRTDRDNATDQTLLILRLEALREWFWADLLQSSPTQFDQGKGDRGLRRFERINRLLAEDSLIQATAQLRGGQLPWPADVSASRRFIQVIFHGLMSATFNGAPASSAGGATGWPLSGHSGYLPREPQKRFAFLYQFVFRHCVENAPQWTLGRGHARDEARFTLLAMFANPGWARRVLGVLHSIPSSRRSFEHFSAFETLTGSGFVRALDPDQPHLRGSLGFDLFLALLHSAQHIGFRTQVAGSERTAAELRSLAGNAPQVSIDARKSSSERSWRSAAVVALLDQARGLLDDRENQAGPQGDYAITDWRLHSFKKLRIDALDAVLKFGPAQLACIESLEQLGITQPSGLLTLGSAFSEITEKAGFEETVLMPIVAAVTAHSTSRLQSERIADMLYRLGESIAIEADDMDDVADLVGSAARYMNAYCVYWIADRVRSAASLRDLTSLDWPSISSRAMRYFVRVGLKLAKLFGKRADAAASAEDRRHFATQAQAFYEHARARIDVYSRHLFRIPLEQIWTLLLLASAARIRSSLARSIPGEPEHMRRAYLDISLEYICDAEVLLMRLGFHNGLSKRFFLERAKTLSKLTRASTVSQHPSPADLSQCKATWLNAKGPKELRLPVTMELMKNSWWRVAAAGDIKVLRSLALGDVFWTRIVNRIDGNPEQPVERNRAGAKPTPARDFGRSE